MWGIVVGELWVLAYRDNRRIIPPHTPSDAEKTWNSSENLGKALRKNFCYVKFYAGRSTRSERFRDDLRVFKKVL